MADYPVTLPASRMSPLSDIERINGYNRKFTIKYSDVAVSSATASTDTVTVTLGNTPTKWACNQALVNVRTAFAGTSGFSVAVGTTGTTTAAIGNTSVLAAGFKGQASGVPALTNLTSTAAATLVAVFTNSTDNSPSELTAGELDIYLNVLDGDPNNVAGGL